MFKEGDFVAIPLPDGREALGKVLYISAYFKNAIGFVVYGVNYKFSPTDVDSVPLYSRVVLYTNIIAAVHYKWRVLGHREVTDADWLLTKRIVGGEIWIGDEEIGPASAADWDTLPRMLADGMLAVYRKIAEAFP